MIAAVVTIEKRSPAIQIQKQEPIIDPADYRQSRWLSEVRPEQANGAAKLVDFIKRYCYAGVIQPAKAHTSTF